MGVDYGSWAKVAGAPIVRAFTKARINVELQPASESESDNDEEELGMSDTEIAQRRRKL